MKNICKISSFLQLIPREKFNVLCRKWDMDKGVRDFRTWEQTCALILTHIMKLESYREIQATLGIARSTLSDANSKRSYGFFNELCELILKEIKAHTPCRRVRKAMKTLLAIDSSQCQVHGSLAHKLPCRSIGPYRKSRVHKAGIKLHVIWDVGGEWMEDFRITSALCGDSPVSKTFSLSKNKIYVFDRAYNDLSYWFQIHKAGSEFVTRLKSNQAYEKEILKGVSLNQEGILYDGPWEPSKSAQNKCPEEVKDLYFRQIIYRDPETKKVFHFITSNLNLDPFTVTEIYKKRWAVELLFRWLKGHLDIRYFAVKNVNAVKTLLAIAILVQLLVQLLKIVTKKKSSLWECLRELRTSFIRESLTAFGFCPGCRWSTLPTADFKT